MAYNLGGGGGGGGGKGCYLDNFSSEAGKIMICGR